MSNDEIEKEKILVQEAIAKLHDWECPDHARAVKSLRIMNELYALRLKVLRQYQLSLPEPYRTTICNILANGSTGSSLKEYDNEQN